MGYLLGIGTKGIKVITASPSFVTATTTADITVTTAAAAVTAGSSKIVFIQNIGSNNVRLGDASITATRGVRLQAGETIEIGLQNSSYLYAITETGTSTITVMRLL